jgi:hypothetical protein
MTLVAGDPQGGQALARTALRIAPPAGLTGEAAYYEAASRAEARFLTGDLEAARATMTQALTHAPQAFAAHASTLRQLEMLCHETGVDPSWLTAFRPPVCAHFTGHILDASREGALSGGLGEPNGDLRREADRVVREQGIGFAYGGLAAGADIIFAEAVLQAGAELHLVLPVNLDSFVAVSVAPFGADWVERFEHCLARAASVRYASRDPYAGDEQVFAYASQIAMGCAVLRAQTLATEAIQMAVWDGHAAAGPAGVAIDLAYWAKGRRRQAIIPVRRPPPPRASQPDAGNFASRAMKAMLFADVKGFGALRDDQIPAFFEAVMGRMAKVVDELDAGPRHIETWGDGLFLVFDQPIDAAVAALALQEAHRALDLRSLGLPRGLGLRIGGHYGPVHLGANPLTKAPAVIGAHVVVAARIEPDVAPGSACVSEALAGALATFHGERVRCGYVGRTQGRKGFPATPIFNLTRA